MEIYKTESLLEESRVSSEDILETTKTQSFTISIKKS